MPEPSGGAVTFLFSDIEGSTRLWELHPETMRDALARHDALSQAAVTAHGGTVVKTTGDGLHAAFAEPGDAIRATVTLQRALRDPEATAGIALRVRCGLHLGVVQRRDNDFFGIAVHRAARIMRAAHGGQTLISEAVADSVQACMPAGASLREMGVVLLRDLDRPERVYQVLHPDLLQDFPPLRSFDTTPNNLPEQLTSFIGREEDLAHVRQLLQSARLITLLGPGGIGKTRLALQLAAEALDRHPDGAWLVALDSITDAALVPQVVAQAMAVRQDASTPLMQALTSHVKSRRLLLVLDNCEHVLRACAEMANALLRAAPDLRIIATSREALRIAGEQTYPLSTLSLPDEHREMGIEALAHFPAVALFLDRARLQRPGFALTSQTAAAITEICRRVEGIPLAIELAAARVRVLSVEKIAERLQDRLRLLSGGSRLALPRQQTLRALIDWSYDLLTDAEKTMFQRLSVFAGGCTLEAAEEVCAGGIVKEPDALELLASLTEKSLVIFESPETPASYRWLQTIRDFAMEKLEHSAEADAMRDRHLGFYVALAEAAQAGLLGPTQGDWYKRLDSELENLLGAHAWCARDTDSAQKGLRLVSAVRAYWVNRGLFELGARVLDEALLRTGAKASTLARAHALFAAGQIAFFRGRYGEAHGYLEEDLSLMRELGSKSGMVSALAWLGHTAAAQNNSNEARAHLEAALMLAREIGDTISICVALNALAEFQRTEGEMSASLPLYEEGLRLNRVLGNRSNLANALVNLAAASAALGNLDSPVAMLREALALCEAIGSKSQSQFALDVTAGLGMARGAWHQGVRLLGASDEQLKRMGLQREPPDERFIAPLRARARHELGVAAYESAYQTGAALSYDTATGEAALWLRQQA
ncbi:MAG: adenylate/guanylate cyclase domain-containing protein [Betaproteobacteria bacterium]